MTIEDGIKLSNQIGMEVLGCKTWTAYTTHKKPVAKKYKIAKCPICEHSMRLSHRISWKRIEGIQCSGCKNSCLVRDRVCQSLKPYYKCKCNSCRGKICQC